MTFLACRMQINHVLVFDINPQLRLKPRRKQRNKIVKIYICLRSDTHFICWNLMNCVNIIIPTSSYTNLDSNYMYLYWILWSIRACSHYAKFCLFCQKICQREAISSANDFLHPPKFLQAPRNFKDSVD